MDVNKIKNKSSDQPENNRKRKYVPTKDETEIDDSKTKRQFSQPHSNISNYSSTSAIITVYSEANNTCSYTKSETKLEESPEGFDFSNLSSPPASLLPCEENLESYVFDYHKTPHAVEQDIRCKQVTTCIVTPSADLRLCPLPSLSWAHSEDVWKLMCRKDARGSLNRDADVLNYHSGLHIRMRAILLDWLIEVCEVYKLHRETYYLALDFLDRFLSSKIIKINKTHLQLIGITCLFVAAKVEEIYPPKIGEFAYVTDGACTEDDIVKQEILLLKALDWDISPVTIMGWLSLYMQIITTSNQKNYKTIKYSTRNDDAFIYPQFSGMEFAQTAQLLDLCSLDIELSNFPYSVIAAAALSHTYDKKSAIFASGLEWQNIESCAKWMDPFYQVICEEIQTLYLLETNDQIKPSHGLQYICPNLVADESHILQTHTICLSMFDKAMICKENRDKEQQCQNIIYPEVSPNVIEMKCPEGLLTPPASSRKPFDPNIVLDLELEQQAKTK